jgi:thioesterase domain-containing protein/acyl carrier protein
VPGQLYIGGEGLAQGYLNRPDLTAESFIPDAFHSQPGGRLYRTGDVARYLPDGDIQFLGRADHQLKVRGFRIEPGEIEAVLLTHPRVLQALVVLHKDLTDERLVAYLVLDQHEQVVNSELRRHLLLKLPAYMIPTVFIKLEALPLTPNRKVDRRALPSPDAAQQEPGPTFVAPLDDLELRLARIWEEVLNVRPVGVTDDFFQLGGHSLIALRLANQIQQEFGHQLALNELMQSATIQRMAVILRQQDTSAKTPAILVPLQHGEANSPLYWVHPAGGNVLCYYELARLLGPDFPSYALQSKGLNGPEQPHQTVEEMAACYLEEIRRVQPSGPYMVGGHSFGGVVAYEMAQQLQRENQRVALLILLDTTAPRFNEQLAVEDETLRLRSVLSFMERTYGQSLLVETDSLRNLAPDEQLNFLSERLVSKGLISQDAGLDQVQRLMRVYQAHEHAFQHYAPQPCAFKLTLLRASEMLPDDFLYGDFRSHPTLGWSGYCAKPVTVINSPGDHFTMMRPPHVELLAERVRACVTEARLDEENL